MIELIVFDLHGTLTGVNTDDAMPRKGLLAFLQNYPDKKFALATDSKRATAMEYLKKQGIDAYFSRIYGYEDMIGPRERKQKNLLCLVHDFCLLPSQILYISDGASDYDIALHSGVNFAHVPYYLEMDEKFSFSLIHPEEIRGYLDFRWVNN